MRESCQADAAVFSWKSPRTVQPPSHLSARVCNRRDTSTCNGDHARGRAAGAVLTIGYPMTDGRRSIHRPIATIARFSVSETKPRGTLEPPPMQAHSSSRF